MERAVKSDTMLGMFVSRFQNRARNSRRRTIFWLSGSFFPRKIIGYTLKVSKVPAYAYSQNHQGQFFLKCCKLGLVVVLLDEFISTNVRTNSTLFLTILHQSESFVHEFWKKLLVH